MLGIVLLRIALLAALSLATVTKSRLSEPIEIEGLGNSVLIELDENAVPTIIADSQLDAFSGQGFAHARDRFFQMDLMRRQAVMQPARHLIVFTPKSMLRDKRAASPTEAPA